MRLRQQSHPERQGAEKHAETLGVTEHVRFLGNRRDFVELLRHADGFLLTSESESFGVAALEAMSRGRLPGAPGGLEDAAEGSRWRVATVDVSDAS